MKATSIRYFGDYVLLGEIASGGMGVVFNARQVSLNRRVAVKLIRGGRLAGEVELRRFRTEAEATARLDHPHIVPIYEIGEHEGHPFISMKPIEGDSLAERLENTTSSDPPTQPFDARRAALFVAKLTRAVEHAHERGVLHRDIKPGNILIDTTGEPHLTDFGLAKFLETDSSHTMSRAILGTPDYMPPEQAAGGSLRVTAAADVYSLGAVLYVLLTGQPPFHGLTHDETIEWVKTREPRRPRLLNPTLDPGLETICLKCLEKLPEHRYARAELLADDLERWAGGQPILARPPGRWDQLSRWIRSHPAVAGIAATVVLGVVVGLGAGWWIGHNAASARSGAPGKLARVDVSGSAVQAEPNHEYRLASAREIAVTLPTSPSVGDQIRLIGAGAGGWRLIQNSNQAVLTENLGVGTAGHQWIHHEADHQWNSIASSADGMKLVASSFGYRQKGGILYVSTNGGSAWTEYGNQRYWNRCAISADGSTLIAVAAFSRVYVSTNMGHDWYSSTERRNWAAVACSADGRRILAADNGTNVAGGLLYLSTDRGATWQTREAPRNWFHAASSADGQILAACPGESNVKGQAAYGYIYCSTDGGETWTPRLIDRERRWEGLSMSADGQTIGASDDNATEPPGGRFYISTDAGATWTPRGPTLAWYRIAMSADAGVILTYARESVNDVMRLMISRDRGLTWMPGMRQQYWSSLASSADGRRLFAVVGHFDKGNGSGVFRSVPTSQPGSLGSVTGAAQAGLELRYVGNNQFLVTGATGSLTIDGVAVKKQIPLGTAMR